MSHLRTFALAAAHLSLLVGCTKEPAVAPTPAEPSTVTVPSSSPTVTASDPRPLPTVSAPSRPGTPGIPGGKKEGEMCGGIAGFQCAEGLTCKMTGPSHPDQAGTCVKP